MQFSASPFNGSLVACKTVLAFEVWPARLALAASVVFCCMLSVTMADPINWATDSGGNAFDAATIATSGGQTFEWTAGSLSGTVTVRLVKVLDGTVTPSASGTSFLTEIESEFDPIAEYSFEFNGAPSITLEVTNTLPLVYDPDRLDAFGDPGPISVDSHEWTTSGDDWNLSLSGSQLVQAGTPPDQLQIGAADNSSPFSIYTGKTSNVLNGGTLIFKQLADFADTPSSSLQGIAINVVSAIPEPGIGALIVTAFGLLAASRRFRRRG